MEMKPLSEGFGEALLELGENNPELVVIGCDISDSIRVGWYRDAFPERFISVGIAEQNAAGISAGLALAGMVPVYGTYGVFAAGRALDQIRTSIAYPGLKVIICGAHGGISVGPDGGTHQALEDIAAMRVLPGMTVISPSDANVARKATVAAFDSIDGPVYIRTGREPVPLFTDEDEDIEIGKAIVRRRGEDIALMATGPLVYEAMIAAEILENRGVSAEVLDIHTVKPLDRETVLRSAEKCGLVVTLEEHQIAGGLGGCVAELLASEHPVPVEFIGVDDRFGESGAPGVLMEEFGFTGEKIALRVSDMLRRKGDSR